MQEEHNTTQNEENDVSDEVLLDIEEDVEEIIEETPKDPLTLEQEKSNDLFDRLQRLQAEFDNYRKRMDNRILEARKFASEDILLKFLDIYDNFLRALDMDFETDPSSAKKGIEAIQQQFDKTLLLEGVRPIDSVGKIFDPYYQHAVNRVNDPDRPDGIILEEYQRGYMFKEKVLRPAVVSVNHHESQPTPENDDNESETQIDENGE
ncbi:MAG: nucleotide exchange factor GrpE [Candidatus Thorarchaeota archaeon]